MYKGDLACSPQCSRRHRINDVGNNMPVAVVQCAANSLDEPVQSVSAMETLCISYHVDVIFRVPLSDV